MPPARTARIKHVMSGINPQGCQVHAFKAPEPAGARSRFHVAHDYGAAGARPHRHLQPVLLRGDAGGARPSGDSGASKVAAEAGDQEDLAGALRGHSRLRALLGPQRHRAAEILPARLKGGAAQALPRADRGTRQALEILAARRCGAQALGRLHGRLRGHDPPYRDARGALVRGAGRQQVVHAARRGGCDRRADGKARSAISEGGCRCFARDAHLRTALQREASTKARAR